MHPSPLKLYLLRCLRDDCPCLSGASNVFLSSIKFKSTLFIQLNESEGYHRLSPSRVSSQQPDVICFVVNNKYIAATNGFKLCSLISVNTHMRSKSIVKIQQS